MFSKQPHKGKYTLMEMDYGDDMEDTDIAEANENGIAPPKNTPSALDEPIQELVKLIFDKKMMTQQMVWKWFSVEIRFG